MTPSHQPARSARCLTGALALAAVFLVAACGGGSSDSPSSGGSTNPPAAALQINAATYLDAAAIGAIAFERASGLSASLDRAFELMQEAGGTSRSVPCAAAGSVFFAFANPSANSATFVSCEDRGGLLTSGVVNTTGLVVTQTAIRTNLVGANFDLQNVVYRAVPGDGINQTISGALRADRRPDNAMALVGQLGVVRNSRADTYGDVSLVAVGFGSTVVLDSATMSVATPRFAAQPLKLASSTVNGLQVLTMTAPDSSSVKVSTLANATSARPAQLRFDVYAAGNANPVITQILAADDGSYTAALARALQ